MTKTAQQVIAVLVALVAICAMILTLGAMEGAADIYKMKNCKIIIQKSNTVIVEDKRGYRWRYESDSNTALAEGDRVMLVMRGHHTTAIEDDTVIDVIVEKVG